MSVSRGHSPKTELTPDEKLRAAVAHLCDGIAQHSIAALYGVNQGRVNEAIKAIAAVTGHRIAPNGATKAKDPTQ